MADEIKINADEAAEKAYAAAAEKVAAPVAEAKPAAPKIAAKVAEVKAAPAAPKAKTAKAKVAKAPAKAKVAKAPAKAKPAAKVAAPKPVAKAKPVKAAAKAKPAKTTTKPATLLPNFAKLKETAMAKTTDFTTTFQSALTDAQEKAKAAYEKGTAAFGEYNEFTKGNAEALVEAGKLLAAGLKEIGETLVADSKGAYETLVADAKELAAVKSPADFYKLQGELMKKHFDQVVAFGSKQSEAVLKLAGEVATPVSSRISLAMEKFKAAA